MAAALPSTFKVFGCPMQPLCPREAEQRAHCSSDTGHPIGNKSQGEVMRHSKMFHSSVLQINGPQLGIRDEYSGFFFFYSNSLLVMAEVFHSVAWQLFKNAPCSLFEETHCVVKMALQ